MLKIPLHTKIVIGLILGLLFGIISVKLEWDPTITIFYIKPIGTLFINALKMVAIPLVLASLVTGIANLQDVSKLSKMGGKTIVIYLLTTVIATIIGLSIANIISPGEVITEETREELMQMYGDDVEKNSKDALLVKENGPLYPVVNIVPTNIVYALSNNRFMLQVVFFAIVLGIALIKVDGDRKKVVVSFFDGLNEAIILVVKFIMLISPFGVFALIASMIVELISKNPSKLLEVLNALLLYGTSVVLGLTIMAAIVYPMILSLFTKVKYFNFFKAIRPAQLLAFSTSSSSATLPVTLECVEEELKVPEQVSSFVLPLGATINMDGTSLYQSVAAVFIAQALGIDLSISSQVMIVLTAVLASIGSAGVPGAGMVMLVIVLEAIQIPAAGLALIVAPDRILDMCRTVVNVTGDATVATVVAEGMDEKHL